MPLRHRYTGIIEQYRDRLPVHDDTRIISLGEGNTPLIRLNNIPRELKPPPRDERCWNCRSPRSRGE